MWDYASDDDGDIIIDSNGDIGMVGSPFNSDNDYDVVLRDIQTGIIANHLEILKQETEEMRVRAIENLFRNDNRIDTLTVTEIEEGNYDIKFTLKETANG
jgi:hypothetical protein